MAGLYIHIPFCHSRCSYCDFYTVLNTKLIQPFIDALCNEIAMQHTYLGQQQLQTIYFGGGTPSVLDASQLKQIFYQVHKYFTVNENAEITLEANPDDITPAYTETLRSTGINRVSLGTQSFSNHDLKLMNRRHTSQQAISAVKLLHKKGFDNITIDLIYGLPEQTMPMWEENIDKALALPVQHLSCYHLTYEEGTPLFRQKQQNKISPVLETESNHMFEILIDKTTRAGFKHYEVSNFARPGFYSQHNASYWKGTHYLGLGPSAHSYNGNSRQWNKRGISAYIEAMTSQTAFYEREELTAPDKFNEYVLTRLRTMWGCNENEMNTLFKARWVHQFKNNIQRWISSGHVQFENNTWSLQRKGIMISDTIMADLILDE